MAQIIDFWQNVDDDLIKYVQNETSNCYFVIKFVSQEVF